MKRIDNTNHRYAIIINDYIYKDYADMDQLRRGLERFSQRRYKPVAYRLAKLKIKTEEVDKIILVVKYLKINAIML